MIDINGMRYFVDERLRELRRVDNPHERIAFRDEAALHAYLAKPEVTRLRRFRAKVESTDWLEADFFARNRDEAEEKARALDGGLFELKDSDWEITDVDEIPADEPFFPIDD
jgi:hypothetical protein